MAKRIARAINVLHWIIEHATYIESASYDIRYFSFFLISFFTLNPDGRQKVYI